MGCFSYICSLSGLQIQCGDRVRWLLLTQNPYHTPGKWWCYPGDVWVPRTPPLRARYNDYGSIENPQSKLIRDIILDGLRIDMVERGWGPNSCHDVPVTRRGLNWDRLLGAVWEGRLRVRDQVGYYKRHRYVPRGVPTRSRVERRLRAAGLTALVGELKAGTVSVRSHGFGGSGYPGVGSWETREADLEKMRTLLEESYRVTSGTKFGSDDHLVITEKFVSRDPTRERLRPRHLPVAQAMIHEDVWQAALTITNGPDWRRARDARAEQLKLDVRIQDPIDRVLRSGRQDEWRYVRNNGGTTPFLLGVGAVSALVSDRVARGLAHDAPAINKVMRAAAELELLSGGLMALGYSWAPNSTGPQQHLYEHQAKWHEALAAIARNRLKDYEEDR